MGQGTRARQFFWIAAFAALLTFGGKVVQGLGWGDQNQVMTNLLMLPIGIAVFGGVAFLLGLFFKPTPSEPYKSEVAPDKTTVPTAILIGGGIVAGVMVGWAMFSLPETPVQPSPALVATPALPVAAPAPSRWMLSYNGAVVIGDKFATETECERARKQYVDGVIDRERRIWDRPLTAREYAMYQDAIERSQEIVRETQATYCQAYAI